MILERIATVESISATPEEINEQVRQYAAQKQQTVETARKKLAEDGTLDRIQDRMSNDKALSFLFDEAEKGRCAIRRRRERRYRCGLNGQMNRRRQDCGVIRRSTS